MILIVTAFIPLDSHPPPSNSISTCTATCTHLQLFRCHSSGCQGRHCNVERSELVLRDQ
ncbi:hypothetical protein Mapa_007289 [Marchantia paleacea]|nr:hypothetical protein Mapa_007289 [Marchantia paleacea]